MSKSSTPEPGWRTHLKAWLLVPAWALGALLRVVLYARFRTETFDLATLLECLALGLVIDVLTACVVGLPFLLALTVLRLRWLERRLARTAVFSLFYSALVFHAVVQFSFFEEFQARFNHIALDYVLYPGEVLGNIWQSYDVLLVAGGSLASGTALAIWMVRRTRALVLERPSWSSRWRGSLTAVAASAIALVWLVLWPATWMDGDRASNEIAQNGTVQLVRAYLTSSLEYPAYYRTLPESEAHLRAADVLGLARPAEREPLRLVNESVPERADGSRPLDVVVILEESFGSKFVGVLGQGQPLTPDFDRWSRAGLLLTQLVPTGNRTVRGLEAVLCSIVPLPGDSIVKRDKSEEVETLARVFRDEGYDTAFFYGGRGMFDSMRPFMLQNGWQRFVDQAQMPDDAFSTIWGVADEYIFDALLAHQQASAKKNVRSFATLLSVSNHKPFAIPPGNPLNASGLSGRNLAVAYADWSLGRYLDRAQEFGLLDHTLVLIVGDHGARVYGSEKIPVSSYRIPGLFITPDERWHGRRIDRLCSQIDLAPTLLALAGIATRTSFLGQSLLDLPADGGRAFVQHNRDVGLLTDRTLVVLGLQKEVSFYSREGRASNHFRLLSPEQVTPQMRELELDAAAVFQTAYDLYETRSFNSARRHPLLGTH